MNSKTKSGPTDHNGDSMTFSHSTRFINAVKYGEIEIIASLLDSGAAHVDDRSANGLSACHVAVLSNQFDVLQLLINRGANVREVKSRLESLFFAILQKSDPRMLVLLLDAGVPIDNLLQDDLMCLASNAGVPVLERLLARNVDVAALRDVNDNSVFHRVVWNTKQHATNVNEFLVAMRDRAGVDINHANCAGATPLFYASCERNAMVPRILVELGANVDHRAIDGRTALHHACCSFSDGGPTVELLIALGADIDAVSNDGQSACHDAATNQSAASLCALLAAGGDLDQPDNAGDTPRMIMEREYDPQPTNDEIDAARKRIAQLRFEFVRKRALEICIALQSLNLDALQMCEIMIQSFGNLVAFHQWWKLVTAVKHLRKDLMQTPTTKVRCSIR